MAIASTSARISWLTLGALSLFLAFGLIFQMSNWIHSFIDYVGNEVVAGLILKWAIALSLGLGAWASSVWWYEPSAAILKKAWVSGPLFLLATFTAVCAVVTLLIGMGDGDPWSGLPYLWGALLTYGGVSMLARTFR